MKLYFYLFCFISSIFLSSCGNSENKTSPHSPFILLQNYLDSEIASLNASGKSLVKVIKRNGNSEQSVLTHPDWHKELSVFKSRVSDKRNFENSFTLDSTVNSGQTILNYIARDKSVDIQRLSVYKSEQHIDSIYIVTSVSNMYYAASDSLMYLGNGNYRIITWNVPVIGKEIHFELTGSTR